MVRPAHLPTAFAPAERAAPGTVKRQCEAVERSPTVIRLFDTVPIITLILNEERQIVFGNKSLLDFLGEDSLSCVSGKRPGEAIRCVHAFETSGGCGTTEHCSTCGAVIAILTTQRERPGDVRECCIA